MEHSWAGRHHDHEDDSESWVQCPGDDGEQARLARRARQSEYNPDEVEFESLRSGEERTQIADDCVYDDVKPAPDRVLGGILPSLQTIAMIEIMRRFPIVEHLIAILYRSIKCSKSIGKGEYIERNDRLNKGRVRGRPSIETFSLCASALLFNLSGHLLPNNCWRTPGTSSLLTG